MLSALLSKTTRQVNKIWGNIKLQTYNNFKIQGPPPPISYKPDQKIGKNPKDNLDYLKVDIKTQPGDKGSEMVAIYVTIFRNGSPESFPKFVTILKKIVNGQYLSTGP